MSWSCGGGADGVFGAMCVNFIEWWCVVVGVAANLVVVVVNSLLMDPVLFRHQLGCMQALVARWWVRPHGCRSSPLMLSELPLESGLYVETATFWNLCVVASSHLI